MQKISSPSTDPSVLFTSIAGTPNITLGSGVSIPFPASEQFVEILSSQILYSQEE
jgi:hypothetical protein